VITLNILVGGAGMQMGSAFAGMSPDSNSTDIRTLYYALSVSGMSKLLYPEKRKIIPLYQVTHGYCF
jgi:hypothetical protein